jgi:uncharacterized membrane protein YqjE
LGGIKAFVLFLLTGLVMVTIALVHIERGKRGAQILAVAIFATAAAACMWENRNKSDGRANRLRPFRHR